MAFCKCLHGCKTAGGQPKGFNLYRTYVTHMVSLHPDQEVMNEDKTFNSNYMKQSSTAATPAGKTTYSEENIRIRELEVLLDKMELKVEKLEKKLEKKDKQIAELEEVTEEDEKTVEKLKKKLEKKDKKIADLEDDYEVEKVEKTPTRRSIFGPYN